MLNEPVLGPSLSKEQPRATYELGKLTLDVKNRADLRRLLSDLDTNRDGSVNSADQPRLSKENKVAPPAGSSQKVAAGDSNGAAWLASITAAAKTGLEAQRGAVEQGGMWATRYSSVMTALSRSNIDQVVKNPEVLKGYEAQWRTALNNGLTKDQWLTPSAEKKALSMMVSQGIATSESGAKSLLQEMFRDAGKTGFSEQLAKRLAVISAAADNSQ